MAGKFKWGKFSECDINDTFFDSLKEDYPEFEDWFRKKAAEDKEAFVFSDEAGLGAFVCLKPDDNEPIELMDRTLPAAKRFKISTLKLADRFQGLRLGEGAVGIALWHWQKDKSKEIYVTVFEKHKPLISLLELFGFKCIGTLKRTGECAFFRSREQIDYSDPFKSFPFINPNFTVASLIPIKHDWHDTLFPFSELMRTNQEVEEMAAANGITKVYIGTPSSLPNHAVGEPVIVYRISDKEPKTYHSVATSYSVITDIKVIKSGWKYKMSQEDFLRYIGNKSVFTGDELVRIYNTKSPNIVMFEIAYNGFFGKGHNVTHNELKNSGLWFDMHPYHFQYSKEQFVKILQMGDVDVQNVIVN
ncbi:MAG: hypothetical protein WA118_07545 [Carboxydocellales bacterium]